MKLQAKLFFTVGALFLVVAIVLYILPHYLSIRNIDQSEQNLLESFGKKVKERAELDLDTLNGAFGGFEREAVLSRDFFLAIEQNFDELSDQKTESKRSLWRSLAFFLDHKPYDIEFFQLEQEGKLKLSLVLDPEDFKGARFHSLWEEGPAWVYTEAEEIFFALPFLNPQVIDDIEDYLGEIDWKQAAKSLPKQWILFKWEELLEALQAKRFHSEQMERLSKPILEYLLEFSKSQRDDAELKDSVGALFAKVPEKSLIKDKKEKLYQDVPGPLLQVWAQDLAASLIEFYLNDIVEDLTPLNSSLVQGVALNLNSKVSQNEFSTLYLKRSELFPDKGIVNSLPKTKNNEILKGIHVFSEGITEPQGYIGNLSELKDNRVMLLGRTLTSLLTSIAIDRDEQVVIADKNQVIGGIDALGKKLPYTFTKAIPMDLLIKNDLGLFEMEDQIYSYSKYRLTHVSSEMQVYIIRKIQNQIAAFEEILADFYRLIEALSLQLFTVVIIAVCIAIIMLHLVARRVTKPIKELAKAAEGIGRGLEHVRLPPILTGKDEIATLSRSFHFMLEGLRAKEKIRSVLDKVVSKRIADEILENPLELGGEDRVCTVLFIDIRGFTELSQVMPPKEVISLVNNFMSIMSIEIDKHKGVIDKYIGDAIMVLFGVPLQREDHAALAVKCALSMQRVLSEWNEKRKAEKEKTLDAGIGIHTGSVVAGNVGAESRLNYTVLGKNVNLAARLCDSALASQVLISEAVLEQPSVRGYFDVEPVTITSMKGIKEIPKVWRVTGEKES